MGNYALNLRFINAIARLFSIASTKFDWVIKIAEEKVDRWTIIKICKAHATAETLTADHKIPS